MADPKESIKLRAEVKRLGIEGYRTMSLDELRDAVSNGSKGKTAAKSAVKTATGRKSAARVEKPKKSAGRKSASAKSAPAAKSAKTGEAKRPTAGAKKTAAKRGKADVAQVTHTHKSSGRGAPGDVGRTVTCTEPGCRKKAPARGRYAGHCEEHRPTQKTGGRKVLTSKQRAELKKAVDSKKRSSLKSPPKRGRGRPKGSTNKTTAKVRENGEPGRALIIDSEIDWTAEWNVRSETRQIIMKWLRKFEGDQHKVFNKLQDKALEMYPKTSDGRKRKKAEAEKLLKWHILSIKYYFVKATGQHESVTRSNGKKATGARRGPGRPKGSGKSTSGRKAAQKAPTSAKRGRPKGSKNKPKTGKKTAASRKR